MLTADLVRARVKGKDLVLTRLAGKQRDRAVEIAEELLEAVRGQVGCSRETVREVVHGIAVAPRERKLTDGLIKLIDDACEYAEASSVEPVELRRELFLAAAAARRGLEDGSNFDRDAAIGAAAAARGMAPEALEAALFSDLRGAHQLLALAPLTASGLVAAYERASVQAVLLKAVRVIAEVECTHAATARALFRKVKFHRLLCSIEERGGGAYRLAIDGPYSLFESVTKYGLELALVLPALEACDRLELVAEVRWGKERRTAEFRHSQRREAPPVASPAADLPDDVRALHEAFAALDTPWRVEVASRILELPGVGLCVPDLVFERPGQPPVYLEVLGYWSRDAVWRRVELVERGLEARILFAVSSRLRVSEAVLESSDHGALYVYKGAMSARAVERKLDSLIKRGFDIDRRRAKP